MRMVLASLVIALLAEAALIGNWRLLASHDAAPPGIVQFCWIWPLSWLLLLLLGVSAMLLERRLSLRTLGLSSTRVAVIMLLQLLAPMLLVISPLLVLLYCVIMLLTAIGVTQVPPSA